MDKSTRSLPDLIYMLAGVAFLISMVVFYQQLPDQIGVHMNRGAFDQFLDMRLYSLIMPLLMAGYYYYSKIKREDGPRNRLLLVLILGFAHVMILYTNLIGPVTL